MSTAASARNSAELPADRIAMRHIDRSRPCGRCSFLGSREENVLIDRSSDAGSLRVLPFSEVKDGHRGGVSTLAWIHHDGHLLLATGGHDGNVRLWELATDEVLAPIGASVAVPGAAVMALQWKHRGDRLLLAVGDTSGNVTLYRLDGLNALVLMGASVAVPGAAVMALQWKHRGDRLLLAVGDNSGNVTLHHVTDADALAPLGPPLTVYNAAVSSLGWAGNEGRLLLAATSHDRKLGLWELTDDDTLSPLGPPLIAHDAAVSSLGCFSLNGRVLLASAGYDGYVALWEVTRAGALARVGPRLAAHTSPITALAWARHSDRPVLATAGRDLSVRLWDVTPSGALTPIVPRLTAHTAVVSGLAWARHDTRLILASGSEDATVKLWELVEERPVSRLPSYRSDALEGGDDLARTDEARALAELITARSARPPLAIGLLGEWGEGKSHFLRLLQRQVAIAAHPGNVLAHQAVRQVRFNAWHYAETGLWAGLVAEIFGQLTAPADEGHDPDRARKAQRGMLRLAGDVVARRQIRERRDAALARRDDLREALHKRGKWDSLSAAAQLELSAAADGDKPAKRLYEQSTGDLAILWEWLYVTTRAVRGLKWRDLLLLASVLTVAAVLMVAGAFGSRFLAAIGLVPMIATAELLRRFARRTRTKLTGLLDKVHGFAEQQRARLQTMEDVAAAEVTDLEAQLQNLTAAGRLAGLIGERAATEDYRSRLGVMTAIREDFSRMAALLAAAADEPPRSSVQAAVAPDTEPAAADRAVTDEVGDALPSISRIVVYIDDLDRCSPSRVVEMLEAIHLLLAVDLFVVVVAIDPRWLLRSVAVHYQTLLQVPAGALGQAEDEELWLSSPSQYLEKIFQIVLTLPGLDTGGYQRMLRSVVSVAAENTAAGPARAARGPATSPVSAGSSERAATHRDDEDLDGQRVTALRVVECVGPLTLDADEMALLDLLGPPGFVSTPRDVKRLANSYGLLSALRRPHRAVDLAETRGPDVPGASVPGGSGRGASVPGASGPAETEAPPYRPYRAGMVLLAALVAYPALGPELSLYLHKEADEQPGRAWTEFCGALRPRRDGIDGPWYSAAERNLTPERRKQWEALHDALCRITRNASAAGLHLPLRLGPWREWVVPAARLSFSAGRVVKTLRESGDPSP